MNPSEHPSYCMMCDRPNYNGRDLCTPCESDDLDEAPIAWDRNESDACQAGTVGCCIDHDGIATPCETW